MTIWNTAHIDKPPSVELRNWSVYEVLLQGRTAPTRHLVGERRQNPLGKVSSAIVSVDPIQRRILTESGRVYVLDGDCGHSHGGELVWKQWLSMYQLSSYQDVTNELATLLQTEK